MLRSKVCALEWQGMKRICLGSRQAGTKCWRLISAYMWDCRFAFTAGSMVQSGSCRVSNRVFPRRLTVSGNKVLALKCKKKKKNSVTYWKLFDLPKPRGTKTLVCKAPVPFCGWLQVSPNGIFCSSFYCFLCVEGSGWDLVLNFASCPFW